MKIYRGYTKYNIYEQQYETSFFFSETQAKHALWDLLQEHPDELKEYQTYYIENCDTTKESFKEFIYSLFDIPNVWEDVVGIEESEIT